MAHGGEDTREMERADRDLLVQIRTEITRLSSDIKELKEEQKASRADAVRLSIVERNQIGLLERMGAVEKLLVALQSDIRAWVDVNYVKQAEFDPVRRVFWTLLALLVTSVVGAVLALVLV